MRTFELPLFPLNSVLFPEMPLSLHIFEERYKLMINACLEQKRPFGVVLIREGTAENGPLATPYDIGCTAQITNVQSLEEGRLLIIAVGQKRFRILSLNRDQHPYLMGTVAYAPLQEKETALSAEISTHLYPLVLDYLEILTHIGKVRLDPHKIPTNPKSLINLAAAIIQVPLETKQQFLVADTTSQFLNDLCVEYRREVSLLRRMPKEDQGTFSIN